MKSTKMIAIWGNKRMVCSFMVSAVFVAIITTQGQIEISFFRDVNIKNNGNYNIFKTYIHLKCILFENQTCIHFNVFLYITIPIACPLGDKLKISSKGINSINSKICNISASLLFSLNFSQDV